MADEDVANDKPPQIEAGNSEQQKSTSDNSPTKQKKDSLAMGKGQFFGLDRKYFFGGGNDLGGASPTAETRSAPGDLSKLPRAWHHHMDDLLRRNGRAGTQQPGTSQMKRERRQKRDGNSRKNDDGMAEDESSPAKIASAHKMARRSQPDTAAVPHNSAQTPLLLNGQPIRQQSQPQKRRGHLRGTRSNGFASAPPFPKRPSGKDGSAERNGDGEDEDMDDDQYYPWGQQPMNERQKQQQMALIEHELNVMANETLCGLGRWRPGWIQRFARKEWMLILLCWFCTIQGMIVNGLFPSSISTIERRFQFSTSTLGRIMQFYDFGYVLFCIPVSYFGGRHSKSTVLSTGLLLMSLGSLVFTLPHFIADPYTSSYQSDASALSKCFSNDTFYTTSTQISLASNLSSSADSLVEGAEFDALTACPSPENQPGTFRFVFLFCLAHFMHGVGATPLYTIGVSYIDENVGPALSSLYIGIFYAFAIFGPAIGFFASSKFLLWHSDFMNTGQKLQKLIIDLDETDPKWVGAWYLGFLLAAFLGLLAVFPILAFPKLLPESLKWHRTRLQEETMGAKKRSPECCGMPPSNRTTAAVFNSTSVANGAHIDSNFDESSEKAVVIHQFQSTMPALKSRQGPIWYQLWLDVRHIPIAIYKILLNGPYMLITLGMSIDGLIVTGCSTFMSKYLERQFGVAPSKATLFMGAVMVPMAGFGTMFSGIIIHRFRLSCVRTLQYCIALVLCSLLLSPMYFIYCDHDQLVGIERHYPVDDAPANHYDESTDAYIYKLNVQCNAQCQCSPTEYHPVCAERIDGSQMAFYSPCYAGCPQPYSVEQKEYLNCSCVPDETKGGIRRVKKGFCESKCRGLFAFMVFFAPFCFFTFAVGIALITVVLRTVDYDERSFALGIQWILVRIIGTIPAPVVFGWLFDFSCIRQHLDPCSGEHGSCMLYHNKSLADLFLAFTVAGQLVALVCLIGVLMFFANSLRDDPLPATAADAPENNVEATTINQLPEEEEPFTGGKRDRHKQIGETDDDDDDELVREEDECCRNGEKALIKGKLKDADGMVENGEAT